MTQAPASRIAAYMAQLNARVAERQAIETAKQREAAEASAGVSAQNEAYLAEAEGRMVLPESAHLPD